MKLFSKFVGILDIFSKIFKFDYLIIKYLELLLRFVVILEICSKIPQFNYQKIFGVVVEFYWDSRVFFFFFFKMSKFEGSKAKGGLVKRYSGSTNKLRTNGLPRCIGLSKKF